MAYTPSKKAVTMGYYRLEAGIWHKLCKGPAHDEPNGVYLPATDKYWHHRRVNDGHSHAAGAPLSTCRLCTCWLRPGVTRGSHHGLVRATAVRDVYVELVNRVGVTEAARRTGITREQLTSVCVGRARSVRKANLRRVMLELISARRADERRMTHRSTVIRRTMGSREQCIECGTLHDTYTDACGTCTERRRGRSRRAA